MKGLLIKDLCLLRGQKRIVPLFLLLAVWFTVLHQDGFAFPFLGMMATVLASSTISYDELDRGEASLFSLPFSRGAYVTEKYLLTALLLLGAIVLGLVCTLARSAIAHDVELREMGGYIGAMVAVCAIFAGVMLPLRIRFTGDQGRIAMLVLVAVIMLVAVGLIRLLPAQSEAVAGFFTGLTKGALIAGAAGVCVLIVLTGYLLALRWIKKKEF